LKRQKSLYAQLTNESFFILIDPQKLFIFSTLSECTGFSIAVLREDAYGNSTA